jgi:predicted membrane chloride channel (bestrophin family)
MRLAAEAAGLSRHRMRTALLVASIPRQRFEELVESDAPPTVTALAEMGRLRSTEKAHMPLDPRAIAVRALARRVVRLVRLLASPDRFAAECTAIGAELAALPAHKAHMEN